MRAPLFTATNSPNTIVNTFINNVQADGGTADTNLIMDEYNDLHPTIKKQASLTVIGGAYKTGKLYGMNPQTSSLIPFTFTRSGVATRVNNQGLIETVAADVPRMDYDPVTKRFKGLLMEKGSTNLLLRSEELDNASWTKIQGSVTANNVTSPDGNLTADKFVENTANTTHYLHLTDNVSISSGVSMTFSVFVQAAGRNFVHLAAFTGGTNAGAWFSLSNGTVGTRQVNNTGATIQAFSNGWYRCSITWTSTGSLCNVGIITSLADNSSSHTGDGVSGFYLYGAQLEASDYPTSYIPTAGSSVSRGEELCSASVGAWYTSSLECWYSNYNKSYGTAAGNPIKRGGGGTHTVFQISYDNATEFQVRTSGVLEAGAYIVKTMPYSCKSAFAVATNDAAFMSNGVTLATDSSVIFPSSMNTSVSIGVLTDANIKTLAYFPTRLANADLQAITV